MHLRQNTTIRELSLSVNEVCSIARKSQRLTSAQLNDTCVMSVCEVIRCAASLRELDLSHNPWSKKACGVLANALSKNTRITVCDHQPIVPHTFHSTTPALSSPLAGHRVSCGMKEGTTVSMCTVLPVSRSEQSIYTTLARNTMLPVLAEGFRATDSTTMDKQVLRIIFAYMVTLSATG